MDPLLIDVPERIETERLILRCPQPGDGALVNAAVFESLEALRPFMPWAQTAPSVDESELVSRRAQARFRLREDLVMSMFERAADGGEGRYVGGSGSHRISWEVRRFEIGYWPDAAGCDARYAHLRACARYRGAGAAVQRGRRRRAMNPTAARPPNINA